MSKLTVKPGSSVKELKAEIESLRHLLGLAHDHRNELLDRVRWLEKIITGITVSRSPQPDTVAKAMGVDLHTIRR
jgi:hypothetical protein